MTGRPEQVPAHADPLHTAAIFGPAGALVQLGFEYRPGQAALAEHVGRTVSQGGVLLAEAGTGTGKTLAYLAPAVAAGRRVVVSTATRTLQGQIIQKDLPLLAKLTGTGLSFAALKGRRNYLCLHAFDQQHAQPALALDEQGWWALIDAWRHTTVEGDRAELDDVPERAPIWDRLSVGPESCLGGRCPQYATCFVTKARARADAADVVVVNHHLYFGDLAVREAGGRVLPDHDTVVFDEAHAVPDIAAAFFGRTVSTGRLETWLTDVERALTAFGSTPASVVGALAAVGPATEQLFAAVRPSEGRQTWSEERINSTTGTCYLALDAALEASAATLLGHCATGIDLAPLLQRAALLRDDLSRFFDAQPEDEADQVRFVEARGRNTVLSAQPVEPADRLRDSLYDQHQAVIFTSATLTVGGDFSYTRNRLGTPEDADEVVFESPFDWARQARLFLPDDLPAPAEPSFIDAVSWYIEQLCGITEGRAFALFTSYRNMHAVHRLLRRSQLPYPLLCQGEAPRDRLLERFRTTPGAVLCATASFWEGVDVAGEALSLVIIDKIPFGAPNDPVLQARVAAVEAAGGRAFPHLQVPAAALTLKQGFGRLVRTANDRGIVAVLDRRLRRKGYGKRLRAALPPAPVLDSLDEVHDWWHRREAPDDGRL